MAKGTDRATPDLTEDQIKERICENLIKAGVLLRSEVPRYTKVLDTYSEATLVQVMIVSHQLREATGEDIITI